MMDTDSSDDECQDHAPVRIPIGNRPVVFALPGANDLVTNMLQFLGWQPGLCRFSVMDNGEISSKVEETVTNHDVFVVCSRDDVESEVNFSIMRLLLFIGALKSESPFRLTIVLPSLDYARQDRRLRAGEGIASRMLLDLLKTAGADRFLALDLHNEAEAGFAPLGCNLDELSALKYLAHFTRENVREFKDSTKRTLVCPTGGGGMGMTRKMATELGIGFMMVDRIRDGGSGESRGKLKVMSSEPPQSIDAVVIIDDMFDTCGSLAEVCKALRAFAPQSRLYAVATHGYFSANAQDTIRELVQTCCLQWVAVTNTVAQTASSNRFRVGGLHGRLKIVDISKLLAGALMRIYLGASVNVPKFRSIGPVDADNMLQGLRSPTVSLERRATEETRTMPSMSISRS